MPPRTRMTDADPPPQAGPSSPSEASEPVASPPLRPASEAADPDVHRLMLERMAAAEPPVDQPAIDRINVELAELGFA